MDERVVKQGGQGRSVRMGPRVGDGLRGRSREERNALEPGHG